MVNVSERLLLELLRRRAAGIRQYTIARAARLHPSVASAILNGAVPIAVGDARVIALGRVLGVSAEECFSEARDPMSLDGVGQREARR